MSEAPKRVYIGWRHEHYGTAYTTQKFHPYLKKIGVEQLRADLKEAWQPIETAPKDGTEVLALCCEDHTQLVYAMGEGLWKSVSTDRYVIPTHWMPLPNMPKGQDDE